MPIISVDAPDIYACDGGQPEPGEINIYIYIYIIKVFRLDFDIQKFSNLKSMWYKALFSISPVVPGLQYE